MKKNTLFSFALALVLSIMGTAAFSVGFASTNTKPQVTIRQAQILAQDQKQPVKPDDLPDAVQSAISSDYAGWQIAQAFIVTSGDDQYYEVTVKNGSQSQTIKLNADGSDYK